MDTPIWLYAKVSNAVRDMVRQLKDPLEELDRTELMSKCLNATLRLHCELLEQDITLVWIKDGTAPLEKKRTKEDRAKDRKKITDEIEELRTRLKKQDLLERSKADLIRLRKLLSNSVHVAPEEYKIFYSVLEAFGLPVVQAPGEAEAYGAALNKAGLVYGVYSIDTDCYPLEVINMITKIGGFDEEGNTTMDIVHIPTLRKGLGFDREEMRDFCIMCGTDFNKNIPRLAVKGAFEKITTHRSIEEFEEATGKDCSILNYVRSRELLTPPVCILEHDSPELSHNRERFYEDAKEVSLHYHLGDYYAKLVYHHEREIPVELYTPGRKKSAKRRVVVRGEEPELPAFLLAKGKRSLIVEDVTPATSKGLSSKLSRMKLTETSSLTSEDAATLPKAAACGRDNLAQRLAVFEELE